jgi:hypothetical protein
MKRVLLICLSLVLALVGWSAVGADAQVSNKVVVIPLFSNDDAPVPKTGQTATYGTRDDGALQKGVASPSPRFTDNGNGTVTDNLTRLIWMKNANAFGTKTWADALSTANGLKSGDAGTDLTDGSKAGDWRLPNLRELQSLVDYAFVSPALPNTLGTGQWVEGNPFQGVQSSYYWSSTTYANGTTYAGFGSFGDGYPSITVKSNHNYVWCVRGGP